MTQEIKVGDTIGFKSDVEQYHKVIEIVEKRNWAGKMVKSYIVECGPDGFSGEYIRGCKTYEVHEDEVFPD